MFVRGLSNWWTVVPVLRDVASHILNWLLDGSSLSWSSDPSSSGELVPIPWGWEGQLASFWPVKTIFSPVPSVASAIGALVLH